jgi:hypothetical protein
MGADVTWYTVLVTAQHTRYRLSMERDALFRRDWEVDMEAVSGALPGRVRPAEIYEVRYSPLTAPEDERVRLFWTGEEPASEHTAEVPRPPPRCRSLLALAARMLPAAIRAALLAEWLDEIETAAAERRPVVRRSVSIALRGAPRLAVHARLFARPRHERG